MLTRLRFRRRADLLLLVVDVGSAVLVSWLAFLLRFEGDAVPSTYAVRYRIATTIVLVSFVVAARAAGLYRRTALRLGDRRCRRRSRPRSPPAWSCSSSTRPRSAARSPAPGSASSSWAAAAGMGMRALLRRPAAPSCRSGSRSSATPSSARARGPPAEQRPDPGGRHAVQDHRVLPRPASRGDRPARDGTRLDGLIVAADMSPRTSLGSPAAVAGRHGASARPQRRRARHAGGEHRHLPRRARCCASPGRVPAVGRCASGGAAAWRAAWRSSAPAASRPTTAASRPSPSASPPTSWAGHPGHRLLPPAPRHRAGRVARHPPGHAADNPQQIPRHRRAHGPVRAAPGHPHPHPRRRRLQRRQRPRAAAAARDRTPGRHERRRAGVAPRQVGDRRPGLVPDGGVAVGPRVVGARHRRPGGAHLLPRPPRHRLGDDPVWRRPAPAQPAAPARGRRAARRLRALRLPVGDREQPPHGRDRPRRRRRRPAAGHVGQGDVRRGPRAVRPRGGRRQRGCCLGRSSATATAPCRATPSATSTRPRWAGPTRP